MTVYYLNYLERKDVENVDDFPAELEIVFRKIAIHKISCIGENMEFVFYYQYANEDEVSRFWCYIVKSLKGTDYENRIDEDCDGYYSTIKIPKGALPFINFTIVELPLKPNDVLNQAVEINAGI